MKSAILSVALLLFLNLDLMASQGVSNCRLPKLTGFCRGRFPRFYYNAAKGRCEGFIYGGCGGNGNNFKTLKECQQTCICPLPPQTGHCRGYFPRYHFDEASGQCKKFIYGGCGGNENNFKTLKECQKTCICPLPSQTGLCKGYFPRYHFDEASGQCEKFIYGGCGGNENNFKTLKECQQTCGAK